MVIDGDLTFRDQRVLGLVFDPGARLCHRFVKWRI